MKLSNILLFQFSILYYSSNGTSTKNDNIPSKNKEIDNNNHNVMTDDKNDNLNNEKYYEKSFLIVNFISIFISFCLLFFLIYLTIIYYNNIKDIELFIFDISLFSIVN